VPTDLIEINPDHPSEEALDRAAAVVRRGGIVAIPSDALYTLVADPFSLKAIGRVFEAKGRQPQRSLPLLVTDIMMAEEIVTEMTVRFQKLARRFWPGPLTIIVPAASRIPLRVTGNTGRLAIRQSKAVTANKLLEMMGQPLVATSANISGAPTCRTGIECFAVMDGRVDLVLDGGHCVGEGSTTVDITEPYWRMIKEGSISEKEIAETLRGQ
jgi:L-threonylcarbamoyladenylate synthase